MREHVHGCTDIRAWEQAPEGSQVSKMGRGGPSSEVEKVDPQTGSHLTLKLPAEGLANLFGERITNGVLQVPVH